MRIIARKVLIIGIDGLDPLLVERWREDLPNLNKLASEGVFLKLCSVFPPDSIPAWTSIYTGLNPAAHGLLQSIDYLGRGKKKLAVDFSLFREKTFWDRASAEGKRVCIVNPFLAYPAWPVNGLMLSGPVFVGGEVKAHPGNILDEYDVPPLGGIVDFPTRSTLDSFCRVSRETTERLAELGVALLEREEWDLFFICFLTADRIQHFLWRYCDADDPTCPNDPARGDVIKDFYILFDLIIGRFWERAGEGTAILVLSDHGHGRRSTKTLNLNEFLRRKGYLSSRVRQVKLLDHRYLLERTKTKILELMYRHDLEDAISRMAKFIPKKKVLKDSSFITDRQGSLAYTPDFAGRNPFGGVVICRPEAEDRGYDYEDLRNRLIEEIAQIRDPESGRKVVRWVDRREKIYDGPHIGKYPDLVFELDEEYGVSWTLHGDMVGINPTHKKISGGHRREGVLLMANTERRVTTAKPRLMDIAPTVLDLLGLPSDDHHQGSSIFR